MLPVRGEVLTLTGWRLCGPVLLASCRMQQEGRQQRPVCMAGLLAWGNDIPSRPASSLALHSPPVSRPTSYAPELDHAPGQQEEQSGVGSAAPQPQPTALDCLISLGKACMAVEPKARPAFLQVVNRLDEIMAIAENQLLLQH